MLDHLAHRTATEAEKAQAVFKARDNIYENPDKDDPNKINLNDIVEKRAENVSEHSSHRDECTRSYDRGTRARLWRARLRVCVLLPIGALTPERTPRLLRILGNTQAAPKPVKAKTRRKFRKGRGDKAKPTGPADEERTDDRARDDEL